MLKVLMLRKQLDEISEKLTEARAVQTAAEERANSEEWSEREAQLADAIGEATTEEEKNTVKEAVEKYESDKAEADKAKAEADGNVADLEKKVTDLEKEIEDLEEGQKVSKKEEPAEEPETPKKGLLLLNRRMLKRSLKEPVILWESVET